MAENRFDPSKLEDLDLNVSEAEIAGIRAKINRLSPDEVEFLIAAMKKITAEDQQRKALFDGAKFLLKIVSLLT